MRRVGARSSPRSLAIEVRALVDVPDILETLDGASVERSSDNMWSVVDPRGGAPWPDAGWKLHISASTRTALDTLAAALPILRAERVRFKVCASLQQLAEINQAMHGLTQIGKFATVYPDDAAAAYRIGSALAAALRGHAGPRLRFERRVASDAPVWYRFGAFTTRYGLSAHGSLVSLLFGEGGATPDRRDDVAVPLWAEADPFAGGDDDDPAATAIGGRFILVRTIASSYKTDVFEAVDLQGSDETTCVVKRARAETICDDAHDAISLLRRERTTLERLAQVGIAPRVIAFLEEGGDAFLAMTYEPGISLDRYLLTSRALGRRLEAAAVVRFADVLSATLEAAHRAGVAHRDLKGENVLVCDDGSLRLLDWDASAQLDDSHFPRIATHGYTDPSDAPVASDVRGIASLLASLATGIDANRLPDTTRLASAFERLRGDLPGPLRGAVRAALEAPQRFVTLADWREAAQTMPFEPTESLLATRAWLSDGELARTVRWLIALAHETPDGVAWVSGDRERFGASLRDVYGGVAGIAAVLDAAGTALGIGDALACAERARAELRSLDFERHVWHPGLLIGESGVGLVLLDAWRLHGDARDRDMAREIARNVATRSGASPDFISGDAGIVFFQARACREFEDAALREALARRVDALLASSTAERGLRWWRFPADVPTFGGEVPLGYAHGTAGIADALLAASHVLDDRRLRPAVSEAAAFLRDRAVAAEGDGLTWPNIDGTPPMMIAWCHGAAGIARFFLHLSEFEPDALDVAARAARTVLATGDGLGATWCHGLGGAIETLLDVGHSASDEALVNGAKQLARSYDYWRRDAPDGTPLWVGDEPSIVTPDAYVGVAGVVAATLRLEGRAASSVALAL